MVCCVVTFTVGVGDLGVLNAIARACGGKQIETRVDDQEQPKRSKRQRTETSFGPDFLTAFLTEMQDVDGLDEIYGMSTGSR